MVQSWRRKREERGRKSVCVYVKARDGIREIGVTGVQTWDLAIYVNGL